MRTADFDYELPAGHIAQQPIEPRDAARLLVLHRASGRIEHRGVRDLPSLLEPGDVLVANRSRVLPARIVGTLGGGGRAELLLLRRLEPGRWQALGRPARRLRRGDIVSVRPGLSVRITQALDEGIREIAVELGATDGEAEGASSAPDVALLAAGNTPLPPYIRGWAGDPERYQTIFADTEGSAAAPTAGLHFTPALLAALRERGVEIHTLLLHVGLDTFRPVSEEDARAHQMHREWYEIPTDVQAAIRTAQREGRRVVAIGTTSVRALEAWAASQRSEGWTDLFIVPGHEFRVVQAMLTNFHLPRSTLLMLVSAFAGRDLVLAAYAEAVREGYRFYSFGDATLMI